MKNTLAVRPANDTTMTAEESANMAACLAAGLTPDECYHHPQHGLLISASGVRKLAAAAPDQKRAREFMEWVEGTVIPQFTGANT